MVLGYRQRPWLRSAIVGVLALAVPRLVLASGLPLKLVKDIPVDQKTRRFDYASLDPVTGRLFVADLAGGRVVVFDTRANQVVGAIAKVQGVHGVLAVPKLGRVYASATGVDELVSINAASLAVTNRAPAGHYPDGIAWAPKQHKIYVSDELGRTLAVVDESATRLLKTIDIGGEVGNTQYDAVSGMIYTNDQTHDDLVVIDPTKDEIVARHPLAACQENHGLLIDAPRRLAYIACQANGRLLTYDLARQSVIDTKSLGADPDVLAYDRGLSRLYVAGEAGVISIFDVSARTPVKRAQAFLADNAHIVAVDSATHHVFFPLRDVMGRSILRVMAP